MASVYPFPPLDPDKLKALMDAGILPQQGGQVAPGPMAMPQQGMQPAPQFRPSSSAPRGLFGNSSALASRGGALRAQQSDSGADNAMVGASPQTPIQPLTDPSLTQRIARPQSPGFFGKGGAGSKIAHSLWDVSALLGNPLAVPHFAREQMASADERAFNNWKRQHDVRRTDELSDRDYEDNQKPRFFQSAPGTDYNKFDPASGQVTSIYQSPTAAQDYASNFGAPGSEGYARAMQDFVLKSWSPTALQGRQALDDYRTRNRIEVKGSPSYSNLHPKPPAPRATHAPSTSNVVAGILAKGASGQQLNPQEQQIFNSYVNGRYRGRSGSAGIPLAGSAGGGSAPIRVNTPEEARKLPPGTVFMTPDGRTKVR